MFARRVAGRVQPPGDISGTIAGFCVEVRCNVNDDGLLTQTEDKLYITVRLTVVKRPPGVGVVCVTAVVVNFERFLELVVSVEQEAFCFAILVPIRDPGSAKRSQVQSSLCLLYTSPSPRD